MQIHDEVHTLVEKLTRNKMKANPDQFRYNLTGTAAMLMRISEVFSKIEIDNNILNKAEVAKSPGHVIDWKLKSDYT